MGSVGGFFARTDIDHLNELLSPILFFPHGHIGGTTSFYQMTVMPCVRELAIV